MWLKRLFFVLLLVSCSLPVVAQDELTDRYLSIRDKLVSMKANSEIVTEQLRTVTEDLRLSQQEAKQWEMTSMTLSENLTSINEQLNSAYENLEAEYQKNRRLAKALYILIGVFILLISTVCVVLYLELTHKTNFI